MANLKRVLAHVTLYVTPYLAVAVSLLVWRMLTAFDIHIGDTSIVTDGLIGGAWGLHAVVSGFVIGWGLRRMDKAEDANDKNDDAAFESLKRRRMPWVMHWFLANVSLVVLSSCWLYPYPDDKTGYFTVSATSLLIAVYWQAAFELNDPEGGFWKIVRKMKVGKQAL